MSLEVEYNTLKENINRYQTQRTQVETKRDIAFQNCQKIKEKYDIKTIEELQDLKETKKQEAKRIIDESNIYLTQCSEQIKGLQA